VKQVVKRERNGQVLVQDVPTPVLRPGWLLVANRYSLISAGTERSVIETAAQSLLEEARSRPDLVKKLVDRARSDGIRSTAAAISNRVGGRSDSLSGLGYSCAGIVLRVGEGVEGLVLGQRVACGGAGWASHAEVVAVPRNLVARVPEKVTLEDAAYATVGAIALHAVRQADVRVGERVGVIGLGLVGQLAIRLLTAAGCEAFGIDLDPAAVELASGIASRALVRDAVALEAAITEATDGIGLDSVLICAATRSSDPLELAARIARDRATLVVVGDVPVAIERALVYDKELELRVSRSYGPGRYDRDYEERGRDLPPGYVRWTEQRNLQAFVDLVAAGKVEPAQLTTHRFSVDDAAEAYSLLTNADAKPRPFGILLEYSFEEKLLQTPSSPTRRPETTRAVRVGVIGAGAFARGMLIPALRAEGASLIAVASERGVSAVDVAAQAGFERVAGSLEEILSDSAIDAVVIATRHANHAELAASALDAGKAVFVEKPLALDAEGLWLVEEAAQGRVLMVGFNRRFAPLTERLRAELSAIEDRVLAIRVNAGPLPASHWLHDPMDGGGRLLGEGCHFVDLLAHLAASPIARAHALAVPQPERPLEASDSLVASVQFVDGGVATLLYSGSGDLALPKERVEAFGGGASIVLDDFTRLEVYRGGRRDVVKQKQDKGHRKQLARFLAAAAGTADPPPLESYLASSRATLALAESLRLGEAVATGLG